MGFLVNLLTFFLSEIKVSVERVLFAVSQKGEGFRAVFKTLRYKSMVKRKCENSNEKISKSEIILTVLY